MATVGEWLNRTFDGWNRLTPQEKKVIRDFPILWAHFELLATNQQAGPESIIIAVNGLGAYPFVQSVQDSIDHFRDRFIENGQLNNYYLAGMRVGLGLGPVARPIVDSALLNTDRSNINCLKASLLMINRLRNNFLHGQKAVYGFADQLDNFNHANKVLMDVIPLFIPPPRQP